jgi:hypothetical protein
MWAYDGYLTAGSWDWPSLGLEYEGVIAKPFFDLGIGELAAENCQACVEQKQDVELLVLEEPENVIETVIF